MNYYMLESCLNDKNVAVYIFVKSGNLKVYFSIPLKWNSDLIKEEFEKNKKKIDKKLFDVITLKAIVFLLNNTENKDKSTFTPNQPS